MTPERLRELFGLDSISGNEIGYERGITTGRVIAIIVVMLLLGAVVAGCFLIPNQLDSIISFFTK